ncbi:MAG: hypothetical protein P1V51_17435 [Deltaproteobacteria bacterium]|nr:hypothetical protein [Deltaproteobacteria bacterium]
MSPALGVVVMMNNYLHDVATALFVSSGVALWAIQKHHLDLSVREANLYFLRLYGSMSRLAKFSLIWILVGGVPRLYFYVDFEWANAVGKVQVPALIVKHVMIFIAVGAGVWLWTRLRKKVARVRASLEASA